MALVALALRRLGPRRVLRAWFIAGFVLAGCYAVYTMEWFDVWRHGVPPLSFLLQAYAPYVLAFSLLGWLAATWLASRVRRDREPTGA